MPRQRDAAVPKPASNGKRVVAEGPAAPVRARAGKSGATRSARAQAPAKPRAAARRPAAGSATDATRLTATGAAAGKRKSAGSEPATTSSAGIERKTVGMLVLERLRERILHGEYAEGAALRQDALAGQLGVSRIPVREALRQLEAEGLVTFSPHVGAVVSTLSLDEIKELFDLRALLESELLRRAMTHIGEEDLEQAAAVLAEYRAAFRRRDVAAWGALNWAFHAALLRPAGQPLTMGILQNLHNQSDRYTRLQLSLTHGEDRAREEHAAILEAVRGCETQHACALLASHILGAGRSLLEFLRADRGLSTAGESDKGA